MLYICSIVVVGYDSQFKKIRFAEKNSSTLENFMKKNFRFFFFKQIINQMLSGRNSLRGLLLSPNILDIVYWILYSILDIGYWSAPVLRQFKKNNFFQQKNHFWCRNMQYYVPSNNSIEIKIQFKVALDLWHEILCPACV